MQAKSEPRFRTAVGGPSCLYLLLVLLFTSCADADGPTEFWAGRATLTEEIRVDPYEHDLVPIRALAVAEDGTIALLQAQDGVVRFFSENGELLREVGGQGQGPGEFTSMTALGWLADTLWVSDLRQRRLTLISPELAFVRNVPFETRARPAPGDVGRIPAFAGGQTLALLPNGSMIQILDVAAEDPVPEPFVDQGVMARVTESGVIERLLHVISTAGLQIVTPEVSMTRPFASFPSFGAAPDGRTSYVVKAALDGEDAGTFVLTAVAAEGDTVFSRRYPFTAKPLPTSVTDSVLDYMIREIGSRAPGLPGAIREQFQPPAIYPPISGLVIGRDGLAFVQMVEDSGMRPYSVVAPDGEPIGTLSLPTDSRLAAAHEERIWVIETDSLDVESVVRYRVQWN